MRSKMDPEVVALLGNSAIAVGIGLFIGLEREHRDIAVSHGKERGESSRPSPSPDGARKGETVLGVRTFALVSLTGWLCALLGARLPWLPVAGVIGASALFAVGHVRDGESGRGLTSEIAALATFLLGMLVHSHRALAVALGLVTMLLLLSKPWFGAWVPRLRRMDLSATLQLLIVLAIGLPLLPKEPIDPWHVLAPRKIGWFITLIAGMSYVGYVLNRILGPERSAGLTGLVGGLASSTAVTAAMAQRARETESMREPGQLAVFVANTVMVIRVVVITAVVSRPVAARLAIPLGAMALPLLAGALWKWRALRNGGSSAHKGRELELRNPFSLWSALKWGLFLAAVLVVAELARRTFGDAGLIASAAASGLADVDAITLAVAERSAAGSLSSGFAALAVTVAILSNTVVKGSMAWISGGRAFGASIAMVFGVASLAGIAAAVISYFTL
jgi:uncharacterized membrane protein (DUF4010 family)